MNPKGLNMTSLVSETSYDPKVWLILLSSKRVISHIEKGKIVFFKSKLSHMYSVVYIYIYLKKMFCQKEKGKKKNNVTSILVKQD